MKTYRMIRCMLSGIVFAACQLVESPLSDVPISEPSVIRVLAEADRDIQSSNSSSSLLRVTLYDKHDEFIELKDGHVSVNGQPMSYHMLGQYERTDNVKPDFDYTFTVSLSDGSEYSCRVHTPKDLHQLNLPATYDRKSPLTITWADADPLAEGSLTFYGDTTWATVYVSPAQGSVTLQPSALSNLHSGQTLHVTLEYKRRGAVDSGFMSTSTVGAWFRISRTMGI